MRETGYKRDAERLLVVSRDASFCAGVRQELERRQNPLPLETVGAVEEARKAIELRPPSVILLEESLLIPEQEGKNGGKPTLWAAATSLSEFAPLVVIGCAEHQSGLAELLAAGSADYVTRSGSCLPVAIGLVERRIRQQRLHVLKPERSVGVFAGKEEPAQEHREFGEILRHELNNPLTGILGNAELLLVELHRKNIELPQPAQVRLETIAALAVRMRETVRKLSEEWEAKSVEARVELAERAN